MRSLFIFLNLAFLTYLSEGAPTTASNSNSQQSAEVTKAVGNLVCRIAGVVVPDACKVLTELRKLGQVVLDPSLQNLHLSTEVLDNLLGGCCPAEAGVSRFAPSAGYESSRRGGGTNGGPDDGADGNGDPAAYSGSGASFNTVNGSPGSGYPSTPNSSGASSNSGNPGAGYPSTPNSSASSNSGNVPNLNSPSPDVRNTGYPSHTYDDDVSDAASSSRDSSGSGTSGVSSNGGVTNSRYASS